MTTTPSEATMRLVRARARLTAQYDRMVASGCMDSERWARLTNQCEDLEYDPVLEDDRAAEDAAGLAETIRLASLVTSSIYRLVRHLERLQGE